jgi:hypothetical protein
MADMVTRLASLDERLRLLEGGQRVGLSGPRAAWGVTVANTTVLNAYDPGPAAATWEDDLGNTGTGYPSITVENCPSRYMLFWSARTSNLINAAGYRCNAAIITIAIDGVDVPALPNVKREFYQFTPTSTEPPLSAITVRKDPPGTMPNLRDISIGILPLSVA